MKKSYSFLALVMLVLSSVSFAQTITQTFSFTGASESFTIPDCVSEVTITAHGASGSSGHASTSPAGLGGNGAVVSGTYAVTPGQVLNIFVGGQGTLTTGGFNGGGVNASNSSAGGGGASDVRLTGSALTDRIIVAGGGGAGGNGGCFGNTINGGNGGPGGGNGAAGVNSTAGGGGFPGVGSVAGSFGIGCGPFQGQAGVSGANGVGGEGGLGTDLCSTSPTSGGAGGGGFIGGGGGGAGAAGTVGCQFNDTGAGGGGAGGDCYLDPSMTSTTINVGGATAGNGLVTISYTELTNGVTQLSATQLSSDQNGASYQWIDCATSQPIDGEVGQTFTATVNGSYAVEITSNGCVIQSACTDLLSVGLNELTSDLIIVYPNPTNGIFSVDLSNVDADNVLVLNALGQEVYSAKCSGNIVTVDLKDNALGVYTVLVETNKGTLTQRIIKE